MPTLVKLTYLHSTFEPMDIAIWRFVLATPIMSMIVSMLILSEVIQSLQWLGAALIVLSVIVLQLRPRDRIDLSIAHEAG